MPARIQDDVSCPRCGGRIAKLESFEDRETGRLICPFFCADKGGEKCFQVLLSARLEDGGTRVTTCELQTAFDAVAITGAAYTFIPAEDDPKRTPSGPSLN
jgi:hypothetical protein